MGPSRDVARLGCDRLRPVSLCLNPFYQNEMDFVTAIRTARTASGLTQTELAQRVGCSLHAIWEVERGNGTVSLLDRIILKLGLRHGHPPARAGSGPHRDPVCRPEGSSPEGPGGR